MMFFRVITILFACMLVESSGGQAAGSPRADSTSWQLGPFERVPGARPIITSNPKSTFEDPILGKAVRWEALHTFNPASIVRNGKVVILYRAEDDSGTMAIGRHTSRLGIAESDDGIHFTSRPEPVFYPAADSQQNREWPGGVEDPRLVEAEDGTYVLTYTQWNRISYSVAIATSRDLVHWTKYGPAFGASGKYAALKYKSAGILTKLDGDRIVAARLHGKYWMFWGEGRVGLATSRDLIHWTPIEGEDGEPLALLKARPGTFDSALPEVGPPPLLTEAGILLVYNGKNDTVHGDPVLAPGTYSGGQALFSAEEPTHLLERPSRPFIRPELPWEQSGQYAAGTTFLEGLVFFKHRWFLYYGSADSFVGVAVKDDQ